MPKTMTRKLHSKISSSDKLITKLVNTEQILKKLPPLSPLDKAKLEHSIAIDHLYYSSKIEGTILNDKQLGNAIYEG